VNAPIRPPPTAFVVDDDEAIRTLWNWLMASNGIGVRTFATAAEFIDHYDPGAPGCLVLDLKLPGMSGLELQEYLVRSRADIPIVVVTGHADVPSAVTALKSGAVDLIEKPFDYREVLAVIRKAFARDAENRERRARDQEIRVRVASLTERERAVLQRVIEGKANKLIAAELDISIKTVEAHRAKLMEKMKVGSVAELVQATLGFSLMDGPPRPG
jgi:FixJ family two-component response regulator